MIRQDLLGNLQVDKIITTSSCSQTLRSKLISDLQIVWLKTCGIHSSSAWNSGFTNPRLEKHYRLVKEHASSGRSTSIAWLKRIKSGVRCSFLKVWVNIEFSGKRVKATERAGDKMKCFEAHMTRLINHMNTDVCRNFWWGWTMNSVKTLTKGNQQPFLLNKLFSKIIPWRTTGPVLEEHLCTLFHDTDTSDQLFFHKRQKKQCRCPGVINHTGGRRPTANQQQNP